MVSGGLIAPFAALGDEEFLSLTTFRKSGQRVSTPMWVTRDGDALVMFAPQASGKVKRLRNDPRVELRPCGRLGRVEEGVEPVAGVAEVLTDEASLERATGLLRRKYGLAGPSVPASRACIALRSASSSLAASCSSGGLRASLSPPSRSRPMR
jgi:uncharacterized protein